ncbi:DUF1810 domain-containing protein [Pseudokordiimonas caeni]|uniref:DUF1810 domain-containing protein n=1 Tax=Pseudokordiimonas caeni TaxID=2997908 RepID=UPI002811D4DE|nr:DUF1810 domain-containing protein [Pseudokordiimonas caeni]
MDSFDLNRFVKAQAPVIDRVEAELTAGRKATHWIWYIFPQVAGLGASTMAADYAIGSLDEAKAYLGHPVLGSRLRHMTRLMLGHTDKSAKTILGEVDAMKFRSSMTLFREAASEPEDTYLFLAALEAFYGGEPDEKTLALLQGA